MIHSNFNENCQSAGFSPRFIFQTYVFPTNTTELYNMLEIGQIICGAADIQLALFYMKQICR